MIWNSLLKGRDVITLGVLWQVNNNIRFIVRKDAWIPSLLDHVLELINKKGIDWDPDMEYLIKLESMSQDLIGIQSKIFNESREAILRIHLPNHRGPGRILWPCEKQGDSL